MLIVPSTVPAFALKPGNGVHCQLCTMLDLGG